MKKKRYRIVKSCLGGIPVRILMVLFTLILIGGSLFILLENQKKRNTRDHREATEASEYGFLQVMEQIREKLNSNEDIRGIEKTEYDRGWYKVNVTMSRSDTILVLVIESEGSCGKQTVVRKENITLYRSVVEGDSVWVPKTK